MKKLLLATAALAIMATAASAADLPQRQVAPAPYVPVVPAFTWTGFYLGLNAGYAFSNSDKINFSDTTPFAGSIKASRDGFIGGAQAGYNWQFGQMVVGAETDIQYTDLKKRGFLGADSARLDTSYLGTVRARLGFVPMDRALLYVTGGLAYGDTKLEAFNAGLGVGASKRDTNVGWTLGAGVEYAITNNITTKLEYLYYDLGDSKLAFGNGVNTASYKANNNGSIIRAGLNYKF
jgi:outer membrane immunogenic protein